MADAESTLELEADLLAALEATAPKPEHGITAGSEATHDHRHDPIPTYSAPPDNEYSLALSSLADYHDYQAESQQPTGTNEAKRYRSPDSLQEDGFAKRQKTDQGDQAGHAGQNVGTEHDAPNPDLAAMLQSALDSLDEGLDSHHTVPDAAPAAPPHASAARSPTISPGPEKVENRIMRTASNSVYMIRNMSLPVLGNVAVQILLRLSQQSRVETELLLADPDSEFRRDYASLREIFLPTRNIFSSTSPLFFPDDLDISDSDDRETVRMSNLASTASSVFGAHDVSSMDVHKSFFSIFVPEDGEYKEALTELFVNLKTQAFIDSLSEHEDAPHVSELLDRFFPANFDELIKERSGDMALNSDEEQLVIQAGERKALLVKSAHDEKIKDYLGSQFSSDQFAESLSTFLRCHLLMVVEYADKYGVNIPLSQEIAEPSHAHCEEQEQEHADLAALLQSATSEIRHDGESKDVDTGVHMTDMSDSLDDGLDISKLLEQELSGHKLEQKDASLDEGILNSAPESDSFVSKGLAALISEKLAGSHEALPDGLPTLPTPSYQNNTHDANTGVHPQFLARINQSSYHSYAPTAALTHSSGATGDSLPPNQTSPTSVLYERARQAAVAKSSNTARREGLHSTRRPWTPEEEKALMAGLDMVKGPHWSQILSLYGANGSISDILKDRTQVQLKDKARNLKLFFLKTNSEMPYYLQSVTGELKTRAPSQAARKEAEEKARLNLEEEQARVQGIMTLAGGLQNNHHSIASSPLAGSSNRASPMTPAFGATGTGASSTSAQAPTSSAPAPSHVPISPLVKTEGSDHHHLHQLSKLPQIQPAPAPSSASGQGPIAPMQYSLKAQPAHQQQRPLHPQSHAPVPQALMAAASPPRVHSYSQAPQNNSHHQNFGLPPIPPNHHSTPDQAQDAKLYETLQAAIAASGNDNHVPVAVPETSAG
ncbi:telomere repeat binding factor-domain-containing protein [Lasiosphaeria hispida]|uniref:Telomere repeat binding factor-domain-containing protein n=1 Tax=Lasiosphaeria hispida TaxID=260671 RepID=A0AAJ0H8R8_9PEZI|nr:telomere repeat binding factor-domain-containing protein [Lasiosphaeria hispida]